MIFHNIETSNVLSDKKQKMILVEDVSVYLVGLFCVKSDVKARSLRTRISNVKKEQHGT